MPAKPNRAELSLLTLDAAGNKHGVPVRSWGTSAALVDCFNAGDNPCAALAVDMTYQQNVLADQDWHNLLYGGKDTSGPTCGTGGDSCGNVTIDFNADSRTATVPGGKTPNNTAGGADNDGYSIGAYELDD